MTHFLRKYLLALAIVGIVWFVMLQLVMAADALLIVQRPGEPEQVKHRYAAMTACTVDLPSETYVQPKGTRLVCLKVKDTKEARAR